MPDPSASRISVALCTFNGGAFLERQLKSIAGQTRKPDELVVCDDVSTDLTRDLLTRFSAGVAFPVRVITHSATLGSTANFEYAIQRCTGSFIALADQDDIWEPNKLARMEREFRNNPNAGYVFSDAEVIDDDDRLLNYRLWESIGFGPPLQHKFAGQGGLSVLVTVNVVTGATMMFRASLRDWVLPIPPCWVHDGWIAALLSCTPHGGVFLPEPLVRYRTHDAQLIGTSRRTLARQVATARAMDRAYFQKLLDGWQALLERLDEKTISPRDLTVRPLIEAKIEHTRRRLTMRSGARLQRWPLIAAEIASGRYGQCSFGWKSVLQDAFL